MRNVPGTYKHVGFTWLLYCKKIVRKRIEEKVRGNERKEMQKKMTKSTPEDLKKFCLMEINSVQCCRNLKGKY